MSSKDEIRSPWAHAIPEIGTAFLRDADILERRKRELLAELAEVQKHEANLFERIHRCGEWSAEELARAVTPSDLGAGMEPAVLAEVARRLPDVVQAPETIEVRLAAVTEALREADKMAEAGLCCTGVGAIRGYLGDVRKAAAKVGVQGGLTEVKGAAA